MLIDFRRSPYLLGQAMSRDQSTDAHEKGYDQRDGQHDQGASHRPLGLDPRYHVGEFLT